MFLISNKQYGILFHCPFKKLINKINSPSMVRWYLNLLLTGGFVYFTHAFCFYENKCICVLRYHFHFFPFSFTYNMYVCGQQKRMYYSISIVVFSRLWIYFIFNMVTNMTNKNLVVLHQINFRIGHHCHRHFANTQYLNGLRFFWLKSIQYKY